MIKKLSEGMLLYHGIYCAVDAPDLEKCSLYKDFGRGFYLTSDLDQAEAFAKISTAKAKRNGIIEDRQRYGFVSTFVLSDTSDLNVQKYEDADKEWLRIIIKNRIKSENAIADESSPDIIAGKIANDNTNATLIAYMSGLYGEIGSEAAEDMCISLLLPERLKDQYCFRTQKAIDSLEFKGKDKIWIL